jgi:cysteine desulfurase
VPYLDYNAGAPLRREAREALLVAFDLDATNPGSGHGAGLLARERLEEARRRLAACVGARPSELIFTSGGTESDNLAVSGLFARRRPRRRVLVASTEHHAVLGACRALTELGAQVVEIPVDPDGALLLEAFDAALDVDTALVAVMRANNETGVCHDVAALAARCEGFGVPLHCDAVQALGKVPLSLRELGCATAAVTAHKVGGPIGVGALFVRRGLDLPPLLHGGGQERGVRPGTQPWALACAFAAAAEAAVAELEAMRTTVAALRDELEAALLAAVPGARVNGLGPRLGGGPERLPNTSSVTLPGLDGPAALLTLDAAGVQVGTGAACATGTPSHVLLAMGRSAAEAHGTLRFSLGAASTREDVEAAVRATMGAWRAQHGAVG